MIAIIDYGVGNLFSLKSSLGAIGQQAVVTRDLEELDRADHLILPGVGAFGDAVQKLRDTGMFQAVLDQAARGKPILGICLGMQLLFARSFEYGEHNGLGLVRGEVRDIRTAIPAGLAVPHMGWNGLHFPQGRPRSPIFAGLEEGEHVYRHDRIWRGADRGGPEWKRIRDSVPSGEERRDGAEDLEGIL